jgi:membrane fusion protein, multidrug efflux system
VDVVFTASERKDVLTVPVTALVALAEGGYGVEVVSGSTSRYVPVTTGLFSNGRVEIEGSGIREGTRVGVPK